MSPTLEPPDLSSVYEWLRGQAAGQDIKMQLHTRLARVDGDFLYLPVFLEGELDAYDKASILQDLEDAWNNQQPKPRRQLLLVPSAD